MGSGEIIARDSPCTIPVKKKGVCHTPLLEIRLNLSRAALPVVPFENFRSATEGALKILDCLSEASFQNLVRLTEQTGPEGERFVGRHSFGYFS